MEPERAEELSKERAERAAAQRARGTLAFLAEASRTLSYEAGLPQALGGVAAAARRSVCDGCMIEVTSPETLAIRVFDGEEGEPELRVALDRLLDRVVRTGSAHLSSESSSQLGEALAPETAKSFRRHGYRSVLGVPLRSPRRCIGAIAWLAREERRYGAADVVVAEDLAGRIGIAVDASAQALSTEALLRDREDRLRRIAEEIRSTLPAMAVELSVMAESPSVAPRDLERFASTTAALWRRVSKLLEAQEAGPSGRSR